ncbi:hypothetical protein OF83DRAFT_1293114, partial [Amylostereum chailletii]
MTRSYSDKVDARAFGFKLQRRRSTGYIGGSILQLLLNDPRFEITALVRSVQKAKKLNDIGVKTVVASLEDSDVLTEEVAKADIVLHTADADHLEAARAILKGLKARHEKTGGVPILIHTSGTGVLADNAAGEYATDTIYHDSSVEEIESLKPSQVHRNVDLEIVAADQAGYVRTFIILPSTIWGILTGGLVDLGVAHANSIQIPAAIRASIDRGQGGVVGKGLNLWPHVEIHELADMYKIILDAAINDPKNTPRGREGFFFGENGEYRLLDAAKAYTATLYAAGKSKTAEPTSFTSEEVQKYFG